MGGRRSLLPPAEILPVYFPLISNLLQTPHSTPARIHPHPMMCCPGSHSAKPCFPFLPHAPDMLRVDSQILESVDTLLKKHGPHFYFKLYYGY